MTDKKPARPGSARAKLESFDRLNKGKESMMKKLVIVMALLILALVIQFVIVRVGGGNDYFEVPKDASWMIREGKWEDLRGLCTDDVTVEGAGINSADALIDFLSGYGKNGVPAYASVPHKWVKQKGGARIEFFAVWSRGDMNAAATIPLIRTWLLDCMLVRDGGWKVKEVKIRPTMSSPAESGEIEKLIRGK